MTPYAPKATIWKLDPSRIRPECRASWEDHYAIMKAEKEAALAEYYAQHNITTDLLTELKGYRLAVYMKGVEIPGGLQGIGAAIESK